MRTLSLLVFGLLAAMNAFGLVFEDPFDDGILDARWMERMYSPRSSIVESEGVLRLTEHGQIRSVEDFPSCTIEGTARLVGSSYDQLAVSFRKNGTDESDGLACGISAIPLHPAGDSRNYNVYLVGFEGGVRQLLAVATSSVPMNAYFDYRIEDDGQRVQVFVDDMASPVIDVETDIWAGDRVGVANRELYGCVTELDWVSIVGEGRRLSVFANGADESVILKRGEPLQVSMELDADGASGDVWILVVTPWRFPFNLYAFVFSRANAEGGWRPWLFTGYRPSTHGQIPVIERTILESSDLPAGLYTFYVGYDEVENRRIDFDTLQVDSLSVLIER